MSEVTTEQTNELTLCELFANILNSSVLISQEDLCVATRTRDIAVTIKGRVSRSPLVLPAFFSFESMDAEGNTLNLGETVILEDEINPFMSALRALGIEVTALHNHWLFEEPRLFYMHFLSVEDPIIFASKVAVAFQLLDLGLFQ